MVIVSLRVGRGVCRRGMLEQSEGAARLSAVHPGGVNVLFCLGLERGLEDSCAAAS